MCVCVRACVRACVCVCVTKWFIRIYYQLFLALCFVMHKAVIHYHTSFNFRHQLKKKNQTQITALCITKHRHKYMHLIYCNCNRLYVVSEHKWINKTLVLSEVLWWLSVGGNDESIVAVAADGQGNNNNKNKTFMGLISCIHIRLLVVAVLRGIVLICFAKRNVLLLLICLFSYCQQQQQKIYILY